MMKKIFKHSTSLRFITDLKMFRRCLQCFFIFLLLLFLSCFVTSGLATGHCPVSFSRLLTFERTVYTFNLFSLFITHFSTFSGNS